MRWRQPEGEKSEILPCLVHKVQCQQSKWISHSPVGDGMWCGLTQLCADPVHINSPSASQPATAPSLNPLLVIELINVENIRAITAIPPFMLVLGK